MQNETFETVMDSLKQEYDQEYARMLFLEKYFGKNNNDDMFVNGTLDKEKYEKYLKLQNARMLYLEKYFNDIISQNKKMNGHEPRHQTMTSFNDKMSIDSVFIHRTKDGVRVSFDPKKYAEYLKYENSRFF